MTYYLCPNCGEPDCPKVGYDQWKCMKCGHVFCLLAALEAVGFWRRVRKALEISAQKN